MSRPAPQAPRTPRPQRRLSRRAALQRISDRNAIRFLARRRFKTHPPVRVHDPEIRPATARNLEFAINSNESPDELATGIAGIGLS